MTAKERVIKAINFDYPDRAPRDLWWLAAVEMTQKEELENLLERIPIDIETPKFKAAAGDRQKGRLTILMPGTSRLRRLKNPVLLFCHNNLLL